MSVEIALKALHAAKQFIANGIELGFIRMPDTPDPAHDTPRLIDEAIASLTCQTCKGNGLIGGPSFYAPDEGGVLCPDCSERVVAVVEREPDYMSRGHFYEGTRKVARRLAAFQELTVGTKLVAYSPSAPKVPVGKVIPKGYRQILVNADFDSLIDAMGRAYEKGYMPDALISDWEKFEFSAIEPLDSVTIPLVQAKTLDEWHEDDGPALWFEWLGDEWRGEAAYVGSPLDTEWPERHTHWIPHPAFPAHPKGD